ncbi:hypothetical protein [Coleofasciculus sp.]|uniref:hypothetical protein n=1 Tax=Coleofasciculus sp. TaxID=3100458 RepID=UPI003A44050E
MNSSPQLIYPTVDLFLYDLVDGLGQSNEQIQENRRRFWQRIYQDSLSDQKLAELQDAEILFSSYIELLGVEKIERFKYPLDGYYYPVKLGDTYALQIDCSGKENEPDWEQLSLEDKLRQIKDIIVEHTHEIPGEMGENWLVLGKLATDNQDPKATAQACYNALQLIPHAKWQRQGTFQGATCFELKQTDTIPDGLNRNHYILICLFPYDTTDTELKDIMGRLYKNLIRLFHYRNKVLWNYEQSHQLKRELKDSSRVIQKLVNALPDRLHASPLNLDELQQDLAHALSISHYYETSLGYLQEQASNLEINTQNYTKRVDAIAQLDPNSDLGFLKDFGEMATEKFLSHIHSDYQTLKAGLNPLETCIKTIAGIIEIEKTKNERTLNQTVAIASVGISTASLAASALTEQAEGIVKSILPVPANQPTPALNHWASFSLIFGLSVLIGIVSALITWRILDIRRKR